MRKLIENMNSLREYIEAMNECSHEADKKIKLIAAFQEYISYGMNLIGTSLLDSENEAFFKIIKSAIDYLDKSDVRTAIRLVDSLTEKNEKITMAMRFFIQDLIYKNNLYTCRFSICMIVKNEEENIERCLSSLQPLVRNGLAELIIVDTGSTDNTVEIARKYTGRVYFHQWRDSFSEARNWSISLATGEYVLIVDADDEIKQSELAKLSYEFSHDEYKKFNTYSMKIKSFLDENLISSTTITQNRIFRNDGSLYYSGSVHNQPYSAPPFKNLDITVTHYGYIMTQELSEKKFIRTVPLLLSELKVCKDTNKELYYRYQLGASYYVHGDLKEALEQTELLLEKIKQIKFDATYLAYLNNAAVIYKSLELYEKVIEVCDFGLKRQDDFIDMVYIKAETLFIKKQFKEAEEWLRNYLELSKEFHNHEIYNDLRFSFYHLESQERASQMKILCEHKLNSTKQIEQFNTPNDYFSFAEECIKINIYKKAEEYYKAGLKLDTKNYSAYNNLAHLLSVIGKNDESIYYYKEALKFADESNKRIIFSNLLLSLNYNPNYNNDKLFLEHKKYNDFFNDENKENKFSKSDLNVNKKLKIGYVSGDFKQHPVMFFAAAPIVAHNKESFELYCYSDVIKADGITKGIRDYVENWRDISHICDDEVEKLIMNDNIDILIDLGGHAGKNRLSLFAKKAAPIQITWIGYPNTTGLNSMDFRITDCYADPVDQSDKYYTEKLIRMPKSFLCYSAAEFPHQEKVIPYKRKNIITFASFNNFTKVTEETIKTWSKILLRLDNAQLILKSDIFIDESISNEVRGRFEDYGINERQIKLMPSDGKYSDHLAKYNDVDIALDTYPYCGTTTTCEAMYMGVPVITLAGDRHAARVGVSLLKNVGLEELIAYSQEEYIEKAVELARDIDKLENIKKDLRKKMIESPLMKADEFVLELEKIYRDVWKNYCHQFKADGNSIENFKVQIKEDIERLINTGSLDQAKNLINEYEKVIKNDLEICSMKAIIEIMNNNLEAAEGILNEGLSIDSKSYDLLYNMAYVQEMLGEKELSNYFSRKADLIKVGVKEDSEAIESIDMDKVVESKYGKKIEELAEDNLKNYKILIGSPVRQKPEILKEFLCSLRELRIKDTQVDFYFVDDNESREASDLLKNFNLHMSNVMIVQGDKDEKYVCDSINHKWKEELIWKVASYKDEIINYAKEKQYDFLFLIDSDLIVSPDALQILISSNKDIVSEIYWTKWDNQDMELPQVWVSGQYNLFYKNEEEKLNKQEKKSRINGFVKCMKIPGVYEVGGLGACTLISKHALMKGVCFKKVEDYDYLGEDRHFCERARRLGLKLYVDTHNPAYHIYRESELNGLETYKRNSLKKLLYKQEEFTRTAVKAENNKVTLSMLVRNEGNRYLRRVLEHAIEYIDEAVILDDGSDDNTVDICKEVLKHIPHTIVSKNTSGFHNEVDLRKQQWELTTKTNPDWILCLDADEIFEEKFKYELRNLINQPYYDYYSFRLYDFWDEKHYREDKYWKAHLNYRTFLVRYQPTFKYIWQETPQHCGRLPMNIYELPGAISCMRIKHYGWAKEEDRLDKYERYMKLDREGKAGSLGQYKSILDKEPNLVKWEE